MLDTCPSGRQVEITYNDQRATVVEVGGGIRRCEVGGRSVLTRTRSTSSSTGGTGLRSSPGWPNRLVDGPYGVNDEHQLAAGTEPVDGTANDFRESSVVVRVGDGRAWACLGRTDGRTVEVWAEESCRVMELL